MIAQTSISYIIKNSRTKDPETKLILNSFGYGVLIQYLLSTMNTQLYFSTCNVQTLCRSYRLCQKYFQTMTELSGKNWDLSLYELHRTPQEAITDNTKILISPKDLQSELTCPICLEMLTQTMTTKECLHRFCAECITTALRSGNLIVNIEYLAQSFSPR